MGVIKSKAKFRMTFGERLRRLRKLNKLTQDQLARKVETDQQMISYYERGERNPLPDMLNRLALELHTTSDFLIGLSDDSLPLTDDERELVRAYRRGDLKALNTLMHRKARKDMGI